MLRNAPVRQFHEQYGFTAMNQSAAAKSYRLAQKDLVLTRCGWIEVKDQVSNLHRQRDAGDVRKNTVH